MLTYWLRRRRRLGKPTEVKTELTPMIDVVFLLLIFFVLNLKFKVLEGEIESYLPKGRGGNPDQGIVDPIDLGELRLKLLWLDAGGRRSSSETEGEGFLVLKIGRKVYNAPGAIVAGNVGEHPVWEKLYQDIEVAQDAYRERGRSGLPVIIDAREQVPYQYVVRALNEVVRAEVSDVTFAAPARPF